MRPPSWNSRALRRRSIGLPSAPGDGETVAAGLAKGRHVQGMRKGRIVHGDGKERFAGPLAARHGPKPRAADLRPCAGRGFCQDCMAWRVWLGRAGVCGKADEQIQIQRSDMSRVFVRFAVV